MLTSNTSVGSYQYVMNAECWSCFLSLCLWAQLFGTVVFFPLRQRRHLSVFCLELQRFIDSFKFTSVSLMLLRLYFTDTLDARIESLVYFAALILCFHRHIWVSSCPKMFFFFFFFVLFEDTFKAFRQSLDCRHLNESFQTPSPSIQLDRCHRGPGLHLNALHSAALAGTEIPF